MRSNQRIESLDLTYVRGLAPAERRAIREKANISRAMLARDLGCHADTVFRYENGEVVPGNRFGPKYGALLRQLEELLNKPGIPIITLGNTDT